TKDSGFCSRRTRGCSIRRGTIEWTSSANELERHAPSRPQVWDATARVPPVLPSPSPERITAMRAAAADGAFAASSSFRFKQDGVNVGKVFELQARNFLADEPFDCLQRRKLLAVHQRK